MPRSDGAPRAYDNIVQITDQVQIGMRASTRRGSWYLVKVGNQFPRLSLRTTDRRQATALALKAYQAWLEDPAGDWRSVGGMTAHHVGFKKAAEEWLATQARDVGYKSDVIRKFLNPFFHGDRQITNMAVIDDAAIEDYKVWRRSFWLTAAADAERGKALKIKVAQGAANFEEPSPNTLNREYPTLRQILAYAHRRGYMGSAPAPVIQSEAGTINRRPAFLGDDFNKLMVEADKWIGEAETDDLRMRRQLLADWIYVLRYTGLRPPHETDRLIWNSVDLNRTNILHVSDNSKTGRREVPLRREAVNRLQSMWDRRAAHAEKSKTPFLPTEPVFGLETGEAYGDLGNMFNKLVKRCNFPRRPDTLFYSPYSLRHTYATFALAEGRQYPWLEEVMGTSTKMLRDHYKQGTIEQTQAYLREKGLLPKEMNPDAWKPLELTADPKLQGIRLIVSD